MKQKTLSNPAQTIAYIRPRAVFASLSNRAFDVLSFLLESNINLKKLYFSQKTIGEAINKSARTVYEAINDLESVGLITTETRNYQTLIYTINPILFTANWHSELWHWFKRYPPLGHSLWVGLLFSTSQCFGKEVPTTDIKSGRREDVSLSLRSSLSRNYKAFLLSGSLSYDTVTNKGARVSTEAGHNLVRGIGLALNKRGSYMTNDETLNLFAFPTSVLERVCQEIKTATGLESPAAFFFGRCRHYTIESGVKPDWGRVHMLRESGYRVLSESEERKNVSNKEIGESKYTQKREQAKSPYMTQVKRTMEEERAKAEARRPRIESLEAEVENFKRHNEAFRQANPNMTGIQLSVLKLGESRLASLERELAEAKGIQISNTAKDSTLSNVVVAHGSQKVNPMANLNVSPQKRDTSEAKGESDGDVLHDQGECGTDAQTSFISGSAL